MDLYNDTYLPDILHNIAQGLLIPTMVLIIILLLATIFFFAQIIVEFFTERSHFKQNMARIVNDLNDAPYDKLTDVVLESKLLRYQKASLVTVTRNMGLPEESLFALAQIEITALERRFQRRLAWTDTMSKIAPLLGLMGTLIPLGPGIVAMGQGDISSLSSSLLLAFDATVCGLVCAIVSLIISKIRTGWYGEYVGSVESLMTCVTDKADTARKDGVVLPANYSGNPIAEMKAADAKTAKKVVPAAPEAPEAPASIDSSANRGA